MEKPSDIHRKRKNRLTRRRLFNYLIGAGFTLSTARVLTKDDLTAAASDQVPISLTPDGSSKVLVDADWYDMLQHARDVHKNMEANWLNNKDVYGVWLDAGQDGTNPSITISLDEKSNSKDETRGEIPERRDGVRVDIEEDDPRKAEHVCDPKRKSDTSEIPGGLSVTFSGSGGSSVGTLTPRVVDNNWNYTPSLMTAAHVPHNAADACGESLIGFIARHNGDYIGHVVDVSHSHDFAIIYDPNSPERPLEEVWNPEDHSERYTVYNTMTVDAVDHWLFTGKWLWKFGIGSCLTSGKVKYRGTGEAAYYNDYCTNVYEDCVRWGSFFDITEGDSGSITFGKDPNNPGYLGCNINSLRLTDYSYGPAGYAIYEKYGYLWSDFDF